MDRQTELDLNLQQVQDRISQAARAAGRNVQDITLIAVTKTWPATDISLLADLGVRDIGENKDQEAKEKYAQLGKSGLNWHAIGQIQSNKAKSIATWADVVHGFDRPDLLPALAKATRTSDLEILIQVNLADTPTPGRGGATPAELLPLANLVAQTPGFVLGGVMAVAPLGQDCAPAFERLAKLAQSLQTEHPAANKISAGMSDDLEIAVNFGATHLRIGSSILGHRNYQG